MGQKSRQKKQKQQRLNQLVSPAGTVSVSVSPKANALPASLQGTGVAASSLPAAKPALPRNATPLDIQSDYIRGDILRIVLLLLLMLVLLLVGYLVGQRTSWLSAAGSVLAHFTKLQ